MRLVFRFLFLIAIVSLTGALAGASDDERRSKRERGEFLERSSKKSFDRNRIVGTRRDDVLPGTPGDDLILGNPGCGGDDQVCMNYFGVPTCYVSCTGVGTCPAGYTCQLITRGLPNACADDYLEIGLACLNDCQPGD